jgi:hypothetical protein
MAMATCIASGTSAAHWKKSKTVEAESLRDGSAFLLRHESRFAVSLPGVVLRRSMADSRSKSRQRRTTTTERITLLIRAENQADVLAGIVLLFQRLNVEIDALYIVRRRRSKTMQINVTIEADRQVCGLVEAKLCELANVRSAKMERVTQEVAGETLHEKSTDHYQG